MNSYELVFIMTPVLSEQDFGKMAKKYADLIKKNKGEIVDEEDRGMRSLAYPIQKKATGYYYVIEFKAPGDLISKVELDLKRDENILRFLTVKLDKHAIEYNEKKRKGLIGVKKEKTKQEA